MAREAIKILLVDDDPQALASMRRILEMENYEVVTAVNGKDAFDLMRSDPLRFQLVVTDVRMPEMGGLDFLRAMSISAKEVPIILMTAFGRVEDAVWAMKFGAVDFLTKPFKRGDFLLSVKSALKRSLRLETESIIGTSNEVRKLRDLIGKVSGTQATVLITGESGVGKERVATEIHQRSPRRNQPFVAINCAALPEPLMESELFGYAKGAFSGAEKEKEGLFESANQGVLFLDEIGDMPITLQSKLLRTLQERKVRRIGETKERAVDVRILAATHQDLKGKIQNGLFREDLFFRLNVVQIHVPPLRDRKEDLAELVMHFLAEFSRRHGKKVTDISDSAWKFFLSYHWPGNVRELANVVERGVIFSSGSEILPKDLPLSLVDKKLSQEKVSLEVGVSLKQAEDVLIQKTLEATGGDKNMAAKILGVNSRTIYRRLSKT